MARKFLSLQKCWFLAKVPKSSWHFQSFFSFLIFLSFLSFKNYLSFNSDKVPSLHALKKKKETRILLPEEFIISSGYYEGEESGNFYRPLAAGRSCHTTAPGQNTVAFLKEWDNPQTTTTTKKNYRWKKMLSEKLIFSIKFFLVSRMMPTDLTWLLIDYYIKKKNLFWLLDINILDVVKLGGSNVLEKYGK